MICAGGLSTNWIVDRLRRYCEANQIDLELTACGLSDYLPAAREADAVIMGPQIAYYQKEVEAQVGHEVDTISSRDYALANEKQIIQQILKLIPE